MAERFHDGFDHYNTAQILNKWNSISNAVIAATSGRRGGGAMQFPQGSAIKILDAQGTWIVGVAYNFNSGIANSPQAMITLFNGNNTQIDLAVDGSNGTLLVRRAGTTTIGTSAPGLIVQGFWYYIEFKVLLSTTVGTYEVRINGVTVLSGTGANTQGYVTSATAEQIRVGAAFNGALIDDLYMCDGTGSAPTNDFLGDVRVQWLAPSGAGNHTAWTPNTGANYAAVNEHPANDDTTYVASSTAGQIDTYAMDDLPAGTVFAVQTVIRARKDDGGVRQIAPVFRIGSTDYIGATVSIGDSYQWYTQIYETSPATSAAWTVSEINAAEAGVKLIS